MSALAKVLSQLPRWFFLSLRFAVISLLWCLVPVATMADELDVGRQIYEKGILPNGQLLAGVRAGDQQVVGQEAACANCHRPSGMGGLEGSTFMPPITVDFLFRPEKHALAVTDPSQPMGLTISDHSYSDSGLVNLLINGINYNGRPLTMVMPRYQLDAEAMKSLLGYLHQLSAAPSPGLGPDNELHFATVFTPEVDEKTKAMVKAEINAFVQQHNSNMSTAQRHRRIGFDRLRTTNYPWVFHFWDLKGEPYNWLTQLEANYSQQPVFALVGGVSFQAVDPVQAFCEKNKTPCLLRSVLSSGNASERYSLYYSRGMALDASLFATGLKSGVIKKPAQVLQFMSPDALGEGISTDLGERLKPLNIPEKRLALTKENLPTIRKQLQSLKAKDLVVCWCDQADLDRLGKVHLPKSARIYFSGSLLMMKSGFNEFTRPWQSARMIYPYELPDKRLRQMSTFYSWVASQRFEPINEVIQSDTYFSMLILQEALAEMVDNLYKDYLVERVENIFGMSYDFWGIYSRPSLGPVQRYANTSGYITKFLKKRWVPDSDRIVEE